MVIGAGQAGLSAGYHLAKRGLPFVILDADGGSATTGAPLGSLKLYSPARYDALPGMPFPAPSAHWPTGREMGDYLEAYAGRFDLPVRSGPASNSSSPSTAVSSCRHLTAGASRPGRSSSLPGHSASRRSRSSPISSTRRPAVALARVPQPGPAPGGPGPRRRPVPLRRRHRLRGRQAGHRTILPAVPRPGPDPGHRHEAGHARLASRRVRLPARRHHSDADRAADAARGPHGRRSAAPDPPRRPGGPASSGRARTVGVKDGGRCSPTAPSSTWRMSSGDRLPARLRFVEAPIVGDDGWPVGMRGVSPTVPGLYFLGIPFQYAVTSMWWPAPAETRSTSSTDRRTGARGATKHRSREASGAWAARRSGRQVALLGPT